MTAQLSERSRIKPTVVLHAISVACWAIIVVWAVRMDMGLWGMPGTMGMRFPSFLVMWTLMMAAMMLSSMSPLAVLYGRSMKQQRGRRLSMFSAGYILGWGATGFPAFLIADRFGAFAADRPLLAQSVAVGCFALAGVYQLAPLKRVCLSHCRTPISHLLRYAAFKGTTKDLRVGIHHALFCIGCCWALMVLMVTFGVMNLAAMIGLALVIAVEKRWRYGEAFARFLGVVALMWAVVIIFEPGAAPGLDPSGLMEMNDMKMDVGLGG